MKYLLDIPRTAMEVFDMLPQGTLCEVIDNTLYMSPSPTTSHQRVLGKIFSRFQIFIEENNLGEAFIAPCDVYLDEQRNVVQPGLLFVKKVNAYIIEHKGIVGVPDLVIEILSTNKAHDLERKLELYQRNQLPEYIIIDPETKQQWHYLLQDGSYALQPAETGKLFIRQLGFELNY